MEKCIWELLKDLFPLANVVMLSHLTQGRLGNVAQLNAQRRGRIDFNGQLEFSATVNNSLGLIVLLKSLLVIYCMPSTILRPGREES